MLRVLIVHQSDQVTRDLSQVLEREGYATKLAVNAATALMEAETWNPSLIILDVDLPDLSGYTVLRRVRERRSAVPVIVIGNLTDEAGRARAFQSGADQCLITPCGTVELLARVGRLLPNTGSSNGGLGIIRFGEVEVDPRARTALKSGAPIRLTPKQFDLVVTLFRHGGNAVTRQQLLHEVWGIEAAVETRTVDEHIKEIRRKHEMDRKQPRHFLTVQGWGYRFQS